MSPSTLKLDEEQPNTYRFSYENGFAPACFAEFD
jgi:hypothetical protein